MHSNSIGRALPPLPEEEAIGNPRDFQQQLDAQRKTAGIPAETGNSRGRPSPARAQTPRPQARLNIPYGESALCDGPYLMRASPGDFDSVEYDNPPYLLMSGIETNCPGTRMNFAHGESATMHDGSDFVRAASQDFPSLELNTPPDRLLSGMETRHPESRINLPYNESALRDGPDFERDVSQNSSPATSSESYLSSKPYLASESYSRHHWRNI